MRDDEQLVTLHRFFMRTHEPICERPAILPAFFLCSPSLSFSCLLSTYCLTVCLSSAPWWFSPSPQPANPRVVAAPVAAAPAVAAAGLWRIGCPCLIL